MVPVHGNYLSAAAPEMISTSSLVMTACRWRLYMIVILSIISPAKHHHLSSVCYTRFTTHTHTRLTALFRDYPSEPVPER